MDKIFEKDWKLFRAKLPDWQERFMGELIKEYQEILKTDSVPSARFWGLRKRINEDCKKVGVQARMSRSAMIDNIMLLICEKAINFDDLEGFSEELKDRMKVFFRH